MDFDTILSRLTTRFPESGWTVNLLMSYLTLGTTQGRLIQVTTSPARWQLRRNMAYVYPSNVAYQSLCQTIIPRYSCSGLAASSGVYL